MDSWGGMFLLWTCILCEVFNVIVKDGNTSLFIGRCVLLSAASLELCMHRLNCISSTRQRSCRLRSWGLGWFLDLANVKQLMHSHYCSIDFHVNIWFRPWPVSCGLLVQQRKGREWNIDLNRDLYYWELSCECGIGKRDEIGVAGCVFSSFGVKKCEVSDFWCCPLVSSPFHRNCWGNLERGDASICSCRVTRGTSVIFSKEYI